MPLVQTRGAASAQGFGEFAQAAVAANYIEDVFSTWLYDGTGASQTITNGVDLAGKGGLVWIKTRSNIYSHVLSDTARGATQWLNSATTDASVFRSNYVTAFNSNGFSVGDSSDTSPNFNTMASWTFRKQPKFFDVVTYTGTGSNTTIAHNLGAVPGCIIVKRTDTTAAWAVYHRSLANTQYLVLNTTAAAATGATWWNSTTPTSSVFSVGTDASVNASGGTYVAYVFAHDAGGFGLAGTDNVISCGSFTATGNDNVTLGYEPQWVMAKRTDGTGNWTLFDNMRGMPLSANTYTLYPNTSGAEANTAVQGLTPTATGFNNQWFGGSTNIIYIAIRRGPMKVPTDATKVYKPQLYTGTGATSTVTGVGFTPDVLLNLQRNANGAFFWDKLRGGNLMLRPPLTAAETTGGAGTTIQYGMDGYTLGADTYGGLNVSGATYSFNSLQRAPGFFDEVCFTGNNSYGYKNHNLTVVPELIISKRRDTAQDWLVWQPSSTYVGYLNLTDAFFNNGPSPATATQFTPILDQSSATYVVYLFATCPGVSKVGSYTGNGTTQTINCGFTGGARFVLIKRTDTAGSWYTYDTARGMTVLTDPYLLLNSTAVEVATLGSVTTVSTGFALNSTILAAINVSAGSYIFLAIS